jgi:hypothetical protein
MTQPKAWPVRRVGDRLLCGRPAPDGGCRGEIATIGRTVGSVEQPGYPEVPRGQVAEYVKVPRGLTEDPSGSGYWRPTARAARREAKGRRPALTEARWPSGDIALWPATSLTRWALPLRRLCPVCNVLAIVTAEVLK